MLLKSVFRTIRSSFARYLAILAIIALGVGFFAGLRVSRDAMIETADDYTRELHLYDYRLISTYGFTEDDVLAFGEVAGVSGAYGSVSGDVLVKNESGSDCVLHAHTYLDGVNGLDLVAGRLPESETECVLDARYADESMIGRELVISENMPAEEKDKFSRDRYTVVGIANAAYYLNFERGITSLAGGKVSGFVYLTREAFTSEVSTELYLTLPPSGEIYSEEYEAAVDGVREAVEELLETRANDRFSSFVQEKTAYLEGVQAYLDSMASMLPPETVADYQAQIDAGYAALAALEPPVTYALDRSSNIGYASLENDTSIVSGVANVFPLFFFLVAALVCITTMTRMVGEQRTQNGVLKALGYGDGAVLGQYLLYAGSASLFGCIAGFLLGSRLLPLAFWKVYQIMYTIERPIVFVLDWGLFALCTLLFLVAALGATLFVCLRDLRECAASLIRPKSPAAGKKILIERVKPVWNRIKFLHKVSIRNIVRYRKRMVMMVLGIGGCVALLIAGFGIRDSIQPVANYQFGEIELYDASVLFTEEMDKETQESFRETVREIAPDAAFVYTETLTAIVKGSEKEIHLVAYDETPDGFLDLHEGDEKIAYPAPGEAVVNSRFAKENGLSVGDPITIRDGKGRTLSLTVSGIYDNYIYDYVQVNLQSYRDTTGDAPSPNTAYLRFADGQNAHDAGAFILSTERVASVTLTEELETRVDSMLSSLNYIVLIVLICAGSLSFIVLFNLTNISITERTRELATIKVLGFRTREQNAYVFRENLILTGVSAVVGIPLGFALLWYVLSQIKISTMNFAFRLSPLSLLFSILLTFGFTLLVNLTLRPKIAKINMAEALKAVE